VIALLPVVSAEVVKVAVPELKLADPIEMPPSRNVTTPVGVPAPGAAAVTVAVNVTAWPDTDGFTDEVTVVTLESLFTVWKKVAELLLLKLLSPV
jgi:hypothetical protein